MPLRHGPAETVVDDHADVDCGAIAQLVAQAGRARVGVLGQEQHAVELLLVRDVRLIDARVRQHEAEPVRHHQHSGAVADHLARLAQDHLDQPRVLVDLARERGRLLGGDDGAQIDVAVLGLGDDLLRHHQDVAIAQRLAGARDTVEDDRGEIGAGLDHRDSRQRGQREAPGGAGVAHLPALAAWVRGRGLAGDADAGAVDAVAPVDADQHRGERLGHHRVHQRTGVKAAQPGRGDQLEHRVARFGRVAGHQHVALDVMLLAQVRGADVLERRHHVHLGPDDLLRRHGGRALGRELNAGDLRRHQRHGGVDQDLARERGADGLQIGAMVGEGNGEHHDVRGGGGRAFSSPETVAPGASARMSATALSAFSFARDPMMTG